VLTLIFFVIINSIPFLIFGVNYIDLISSWFKDVIIGSSLTKSAGISNQSLQAAFMRLFSYTHTESMYIGYANITNLSENTLRILIYITSFLILVWLVYIFNKPSFSISSAKLHQLAELGLVFTAIPFISSIAQKAHFVYLILPNAVCVYYLIFARATNHQSKYIFILFFLSFILTTLTCDGFVGRYLSDIFESYSFITIGIFLLFLANSKIIMVYLTKTL
jgi:hypothetical protein